MVKPDLLQHALVDRNQQTRKPGFGSQWTLPVLAAHRTLYEWPKMSLPWFMGLEYGNWSPSASSTQARADSELTLALARKPKTLSSEC